MYVRCHFPPSPAIIYHLNAMRLQTQILIAVNQVPPKINLLLSLIVSMSCFFTMSIEQKKFASHCWTALWLFGHCFILYYYRKRSRRVLLPFELFAPRYVQNTTRFFFDSLVSLKIFKRRRLRTKKVGVSDSQKLRSRWSGVVQLLWRGYYLGFSEFPTS